MTKRQELNHLRRLRTTGFRPLRMGRIHLRCDGCGRKWSNAPRQGDEPEYAFLAELCCERCCLGHMDCGVSYYDSRGSRLLPRLDQPEAPTP